MKNWTMYIAYGSNLNLPQMSYRCPTARVVGKSEIRDYELLFRGGHRNSVATVEPSEGSSVPVLLWELQEKDLLTLDRYEGFPTLYRKKIIDVDLNGKTIPAMIYIMNEGNSCGSPSDYYLNVIMEGYKSAGFDTEYLEQAVEKSIRLSDEQKQENNDLFGMKWW